MALTRSNWPYRRRMRLWTWQATEVARELGRGRRHTADWQRIDPAGHSAYRLMSEAMSGAGLPVDEHPPVWGWLDEPTPATVEDRAYHVVREGDRERGLMVLVLEVPDELVFTSSYSAWCERLADPASERSLDVDPRLGELDVQGCLPHLDPAWVRQSRRLGPDDDAPDDAHDDAHDAPADRPRSVHASGAA